MNTLSNRKHLITHSTVQGLSLDKGAGGEGGIRTHGSLAATRAFQARLLDHSSTSP